MKNVLELMEEAQAYFPAHGWVTGSSGVRLIRFPILRVFQHLHPAYFRYQDLGIAGFWLQTHSPFRTLRLLAIALRDLHYELRVLDPILHQNWFDKPPSEARNQAMTEQSERLERCEVLLISVFTLLRRLADDLMGTLRPLLFDHVDSAPRELKTAIQLAQSGKILKAGPRYEPGVLINILLNETDWLSKLREENGIRDTLIHRPHVLLVGATGASNSSSAEIDWRVYAQVVVQAKTGPKATDIFPLLIDCIEGVCSFMTSITRLIGGMERYENADWMMVLGNDADLIGFWPEIGNSTPRTFPVMD